MPFKDRQQAANRLAEALARYKGLNPLVLAIPRGALPMGKIIADALGGELDVVLVRKLRAPFEPELAIGSVDESGEIYLGKHAHAMAGEAYITVEKEAQMNVMRERRALYSPVHPPVDPVQRVVIVVDDGIATGATMIAALRAVRAKRPQRLIAAMAVSPSGSLKAVRALADEVVCLEVPEDFYAVGQYFEEFPQVTDEEVVAILKQSRSGTPVLK